MRAFLPALALATLLVVLGHDAVMAANPHGQEPATAGHTMVDNPCHRMEGVRPGAIDAADLINGPAVLPQLVPFSCHELARVAWGIPPHHPPDVIRALLQVFLN
jgi:hypothetical protein